LSKLADEFKKDGLIVLAVDAWDEGEEGLASYVKSEKLTHRILLEGSEVTEAYGSGSNVPVVLWIDRKGVVVDTEWGYDGAGSLEAKTRKLLARSK
jgi:hypothetical protein